MKEKKETNFIVYDVIPISLDPVYLLSDFTEHVILGGFSALQVISTNAAEGTKHTLQKKDILLKWEIGFDTDITIQSNTRLLPRNSLDILLNKRHQTNEIMIQYKHLNTVIFSGTMFSSNRSDNPMQNYYFTHIFAI